jgi:hypothetical protein
MDQVNGQKKWELFLEGTKYQVQDLMYVHRICNRIYPSVMAKGMDHVTEQKNWELFPEGTKYQVREPFVRWFVFGIICDGFASIYPWWQRS